MFRRGRPVNVDAKRRYFVYNCPHMRKRVSYPYIYYMSRILVHTRYLFLDCFYYACSPCYGKYCAVNGGDIRTKQLISLYIVGKDENLISLELA